MGVAVAIHMRIPPARLMGRVQNLLRGGPTVIGPSSELLGWTIQLKIEVRGQTSKIQCDLLASCGVEREVVLVAAGTDVGCILNARADPGALRGLFEGIVWLPTVGGTGKMIVDNQLRRNARFTTVKGAVKVDAGTAQVDAMVGAGQPRLRIAGDYPALISRRGIDRGIDTDGVRCGE